MNGGRPCRKLTHMRGTWNMTNTTDTAIDAVYSPTFQVNVTMVSSAPAPVTYRRSPENLWGVIIIALSLILVLSGVVSCFMKLARWRRQRAQELARERRAARKKNEPLPGELTTWAQMALSGKHGSPPAAPEPDTSGTGGPEQQQALAPPPTMEGVETFVTVHIPQQATPLQQTQDEQQQQQVPLQQQKHDELQPQQQQQQQGHQLELQVDPTGPPSAPTPPATPPTCQLEHAASLCAICLEDYASVDHMRLLPCGHYFHQECVDTWLDSQAMVCPLCRTDLRVSPPPSPQRRSVLSAFCLRRPSAQEDEPQATAVSQGAAGQAPASPTGAHAGPPVATSTAAVDALPV